MIIGYQRTKNIANVEVKTHRVVWQRLLLIL
jgi:hypothetical protein